MEQHFELYKNDVERADFCLNVLENLINFHFENATCPEEYVIWSDFIEEYHYLMHAIISTAKGYLKDVKNDKMGAAESR